MGNLLNIAPYVGACVGPICYTLYVGDHSSICWGLVLALSVKHSSICWACVGYVSIWGLVLALSVKHSSICWGLCWPYLLNIAPYVGACVGPIY